MASVEPPCVSLPLFGPTSPCTPKYCRGMKPQSGSSCPQALGGVKEICMNCRRAHRNEAATVDLAGRIIGRGHPPYFIAEMSGNHNHDLKRAIRLIEVAAEAGADAVKLQTYTPDTITIDHDGPDFMITGGLWDGRKLYDLYREAYTPWEWHPELFEHGRRLGLQVFSSVFDETAVDFLEEMGASAYKIASFELLDLPLIRKCALTGKPLIVSTGMAGLSEIQETVEAFHGAGNSRLVLLHCVSGYPAPAAEFNLKTLIHMRETFGLPTGISDHTLGIAVPVAAVALGACVVEKHFTLSRMDGGPDAAFSVEPHELGQMIGACREAFLALGEAGYGPMDSEKANIQFRRSLYVVEDVLMGEPFTPRNVRSIRPGYGLAPKWLDRVLKGKAAANLKRGTALNWDMIEAT